MKTTPCNVCGKPSQYGGCEDCYYNTVGVNEKVELGEKENKNVKSIERLAQAMKYWYLDR